MRYILFPLLVVFQLQAQEVLFEGHVYDNKTKDPIPYVNLSFLNTLKGTSTDEEGHYFVDRVLPMGLKSSAFICQSVTNAVRFIAKKHDISLINYLDDFAGAENGIVTV